MEATPAARRSGGAAETFPHFFSLICVPIVHRFWLIVNTNLELRQDC